MPPREIDELDQYIIFRLQSDAWRMSATEIANEYGVVPSTVRNRINRLKDDGVIRGSHLDIDYELVGYQLFTIIICTASIPERQRLAEESLTVPGVVSVRELMTGEENIHVVAIGRSGDDLDRIGQDLSALGLEIVKKELIHDKHTCPLHWFDTGTKSQDDLEE